MRKSIMVQSVRELTGLFKVDDLNSQRHRKPWLRSATNKLSNFKCTISALDRIVVKRETGAAASGEVASFEQ